MKKLRNILASVLAFLMCFIIGSPAVYAHNGGFNVAMVDNLNLSSKRTIVEKGYILPVSNAQDMVPYIRGQNSFIWTADKYACEVVALTNLVSLMSTKNGYDNLLNKGLTTTFNSIWKYTNTKLEKNSTTSGGTTSFGAWDGIVDYAKSRGYNASTNVYWSTQYSDFVRDIKKGIPCILEYKAFFNNELGGHAVAVLGYVIVKDKTSNKNENYLIVANGWEQKVTYINFDDYRILLKGGFSVNIKKK